MGLREARENNKISQISTEPDNKITELILWSNEAIENL